ncbi:hypothetical protein HZA75_06165 [Candidatus Roizmanbacteria bacterium]|nr:hypothetical protein [Candidatus Roizmanbacteria bacterium]
MVQLEGYQYGFNPFTEAKSYRGLPSEEITKRFNQQRESYVNHLLEDQAVSILYQYWPDKNGNIFTSSSRNERDNVIHQIDFNERNGLFYDGILRTVKQAVRNPGNLVALYSPTGKKLFDSTPGESIPREKLKWLKEPYDIGQLYFLYFDGEKINNVAASVNNDDNPWLIDLASEFGEINKEKDEERRISLFLTTPILLENVDQFLQRDWNDNYHIFKNVHSEDFFLDRVINDMKETFSGKKKLKTPIYYDQTVQSLQRSEITADIITQGYISTVYHFMKERGLSKTKFGGGCPGDGAEMSAVEKILGYDIMRSIAGENMFARNVSSFSSSYRDLRQHKNDENFDEFGSLKFHCPICNGEHTRPRHQLLEKCPIKGKEIPKC